MTKFEESKAERKRMKLLCKLFGHKLDFNPEYDIRPHCVRCGWQDFSLDKWLDNHIY